MAAAARGTHRRVPCGSRPRTAAPAARSAAALRRFDGEKAAVAAAAPGRAIASASSSSSSGSLSGVRYSATMLRHASDRPAGAASAEAGPGRSGGGGSGAGGAAAAGCGGASGSRTSGGAGSGLAAPLIARSRRGGDRLSRTTSAEREDDLRMRCACLVSRRACDLSSADRALAVLPPAGDGAAIGVAIVSGRG